MLIERLVTEVKRTRDEAVSAATAVKSVRGELEGNKAAALRTVDERT